MKRLAKVIGGMMCVAILAVMLPTGTVRADEAGATIVIRKTVTATVETTAWTKPQEGGEALTVFAEGMDILVLEEIDEEWYSIAYQGKIGYVKRADTKDKEMDTAAVDEEMAAEEYESTLWAEEMEKERQEKDRTGIWGIVIAVLIAAIFAVGIGSVIWERKWGKKSSESSPLQKEE